MNKKILFSIFGLLIGNPIYGLCGDWGYYISSGNINATGTYTGVISGYSILTIEMKLPHSFFATTAWINGKCISGKVNSLAILNLKKEIKLNMHGKEITAIGMLDQNDVNLSKKIGYIYPGNGFISFSTIDNYLDSDCGTNGESGKWYNWFDGKNIIKYKITDEIPVGHHTGSVNIGTLNAFREPPPLTHLRTYGTSLNYGVQINMNYTINIANSCKIMPSSLIEIKHKDLTTTNFDGDLIKKNINIQCDNPADITLSLTSSSSSGKAVGTGNKIELPLSTNKPGVSSLLAVEGNSLMYDPSKNKSILKVGSDGAVLQISSMLKKTSDNITPGEYSTNAILTTAFD
ncbi:hypothetical protein [Xenorhabdus bovienii]|uniref:hypothetical protein n=1 Tax=Xenorhabdus bovienii TaxID=40576 RepID=UPI0023B228E6|nr:hypothetical protein [Xenorhabdus bovienii]MDE9453748.1 hypothetical protein [Xenorhabdus bovienii]MDE9541813.1 hypothetical protein [Xenorhabdus bovienii]MDE9563158.1 hypothetical protein [Xenorhabdus bovienii]